MSGNFIRRRQTQTVSVFTTRRSLAQSNTTLMKVSRDAPWFGLASEINTDAQSTNSRTMTIAQLCDHFEQRELAKEDIWRSQPRKKSTMRT